MNLLQFLREGGTFLSGSVLVQYTETQSIPYFTYVVMKHYTIPCIHASRFVNTSGVDLIGPLKGYEGKKYIATAVCYFTKFFEADAIPNKTAHEVGMFIYELFCQ